MDTVDIAAAVRRLCEAPGRARAEDLGLVSQVLAALQPHQPALDLLAATPVAMDMDDGGAAVDPVEAVSVLHVVQRLAREADELKDGVGRGYSEWPRARNRVFVREDRVGEFFAHPQRFQENFGLRPDEFTWLFNRVQGALGALPQRRAFDLRNRLGMALRVCHKDHSEDVRTLPRAALSACSVCSAPAAEAFLSCWPVTFSRRMSPRGLAAAAPRSTTTLTM